MADHFHAWAQDALQKNMNGEDYLRQVIGYGKGTIALRDASAQMQGIIDSLKQQGSHQQMEEMDPNLSPSVRGNGRSMTGEAAHETFRAA